MSGYGRHRSGRARVPDSSRGLPLAPGRRCLASARHRSATACLCPGRCRCRSRSPSRFRGRSRRPGTPGSSCSRSLHRSRCPPTSHHPPSTRPTRWTSSHSTSSSRSTLGWSSRMSPSGTCYPRSGRGLPAGRSRALTVPRSRWTPGVGHLPRTGAGRVVVRRRCGRARPDRGRGRVAVCGRRRLRLGRGFGGLRLRRGLGVSRLRLLGLFRRRLRRYLGRGARTGRSSGPRCGACRVAAVSRPGSLAR